jgi:hypothetical protein
LFIIAKNKNNIVHANLKMIFYATQAILDMISGTTWWLLSRSTKAIYHQLYPCKQVSEIELNNLAVQIQQQSQQIEELKQLIQKNLSKNLSHHSHQ